MSVAWVELSTRTVLSTLPTYLPTYDSQSVPACEPQTAWWVNKFCFANCLVGFPTHQPTNPTIPSTQPSTQPPNQPTQPLVPSILRVKTTNMKNTTDMKTHCQPKTTNTNKARAHFQREARSRTISNWLASSHLMMDTHKNPAVSWHQKLDQCLAVPSRCFTEAERHKLTLCRHIITVSET